MNTINNLRIKIFADGADLDSIFKLARNCCIKGFTTNPTLMRKAGVTNYEEFGRKLLTAIPDKPISLEVFADDLPTMLTQGKAIASWGGQVNVKIPVTNTKGEFTGPVIHALSKAGIVVNVTAIMTPEQVRAVTESLAPDTTAIVSVFAGRVADTGVDPVPLMVCCRDILTARPKAELLWASPRELLNIFQADEIGCHIITLTNDILGKLPIVGKDLTEYSLDTVKMFYNDAALSGYNI